MSDLDYNELETDVNEYHESGEYNFALTISLMSRLSKMGRFKLLLLAI